MGERIRPAKRLAYLVALIALFVLASASTALAAQVAAVAPAEGAVVTSTAMPPINVLVADAVTPIAATMTVDGTARTVIVDATGLSFTYTPAATARLADGVHTVAFSATDALGTPIAKSWTFEVQQVPDMSSVSPANGTIITDRRPYVGITVYDNSLAATYTITVDGVRLGGLNSSGYEATWGGYYGISGYPVSNLADGPHTVYAWVKDPAGHTTERTWTFVVNGQINITADGISEGQLYTTSQPTWHFQGVDVYTSPVNFNLSVDGSGANITNSYLYSNGNRTLDNTSTPNNPLTDGNHVVRVTYWDMKMSKTAQFNIQVQAPPNVFHLRPSPDVADTNTMPTLVARMTENSAATPTVQFTVDGVAVAADPVRKISGTRYEATAKITTPLSANATHTASIEARDASGNIATRSWTFFVASGEKMPHYSAGQCTDCHGNPYYPHAAVGGDAVTYKTQYACNNCHSVFPDHSYYGWYTGVMTAATIDDPATYLPLTWTPTTCSCHSGGHPYYANQANCYNCHSRINTINEQGEPPGGRGETVRLRSETARHAPDGDYSRCTSCHQLDLTYEHAGRTDSLGAAITCQTCHASTDPAVTNAIAAGDSSCVACHPGAGLHPHATGPIDGIEAGDGHLCTECHSTDIVAEHSKSTSGGNDDPCLTCHAGGRARGAKGGATGATCDQPACHGEASAQPMHSTYCGGCHENENTDFSVKQTDFAAPALNKTKCLACHGTGITNAGSYKVGRRWVSYRHLSHNATDECAGCHYWEPRRTEFYTHTVKGAYGFFASVDSTNPAPARAHSVHVNGSWAAPLEFAPQIYCGNCHKAAGCGSCHEVATMPAAHANHGTQTTQTVLAAPGAASYTAPKAALVPETRSCTAAACHGSAATQVPTCTSCHTGRSVKHW